MKRGDGLKRDPVKQREWERRSRKPLNRGALKRSGSGPKPAPAKQRKPLRSQVRRDWSLGRAKVDREGRCRICRRGGKLDAAHIVAREHDFETPVRLTVDGTYAIWTARQGPMVHPDRILPLCPACHRTYDGPATLRGALNMLAHLTREEQVQAVADLGLELARKRICGIELTVREGGKAGWS